MLIQQIIEFDLCEPGTPGRLCIPKTGYFQDKTKIFSANLCVNYYLLTAKNIAEGNAMHLTRLKPSHLQNLT